jgi:hypothetical protein
VFDNTHGRTRLKGGREKCEFIESIEKKNVYFNKHYNKSKRLDSNLLWHVQSLVAFLSSF